MFRLFNRKRSKRPVQDWELVLMYKTIEKLPAEFEYLKRQIEADLFTSSLVGYSASYPDYVAFSYADGISAFERKREHGYKITNIKVRDIGGSKTFMYVIYVHNGVITGYSIHGLEKHIIDVISADTDAYTKEVYGDDNEDYESLKRIIGKDELKLIKPENVYKLNLKGRVFYHIEDLEDGDFIGIESNGQICKITHDPFEVILLKENLAEIIPM